MLDIFAPGKPVQFVSTYFFPLLFSVSDHFFIYKTLLLMRTNESM